MAKILKFGYRKHVAGNPEVIGRLVRKALTAPKPKIRYSAPWDAKLLLFLRKYAPESLFDAHCDIITKARQRSALQSCAEAPCTTSRNKGKHCHSYAKTLENLKKIRTFFFPEES